MMKGVKKLIQENGQGFDDLAWLSLRHDMWSIINMEGALGSSNRLMAKDKQ